VERDARVAERDVLADLLARDVEGAFLLFGSERELRRRRERGR
jgi:hypothetical protein